MTKETLDEGRTDTLLEMEKIVAEKDAALADIQKQFDALKDAAKQIAADFDNFRKRTEAERTKEGERAAKNLLLRLLPLCDHFSLCLEHTAHHDEFVKAVSLLYSQLVTIMEDAGVRQISALRQSFDPRLHEALMYVPSEKEDNIVVEELQKGYLLNDIVLRASKVKVTRKVEG
ncbi:nucleotide exchange factor GrpE [Candidatus Woesearchaeota archaeon]|nr:nucleotide exchange factor GrpE [Candidatus Woesearchaeota archaeon]